MLGNDVVLFLTKPASRRKLTNARLERLTGAAGSGHRAATSPSSARLAEKWGG